MSSRAISPTARLWILDPWRDLALFVLAPLWILPLVWWAKARFDINSVGAIALALGGVGHHLPGFIRAYTDPQLFRRYRARFILAPAFLIAVGIAFSVLHLHALQVILILWGAWHGAMQVNGFLRIYDAKAGSHAPLTARLDWAMCLAWFGAGLLHSPSRITAVLVYFYGSGGPVLEPEAFAFFRMAWDAGTAGITVAFLLNAWRQLRAGRAPSPLKFLVMASSFGFWWFAMVRVDNPIAGLLLFELFHDIQYNSLVWVYNRGRVAQGMAPSRVESFLFRPGAFRVALYALLVLGYGYLGVASGYSGTQAPGILRSTLGSVNAWTGLFTISAFLHFYFDGFIWRVREKELRQGLGIGGGGARAFTEKSAPRRPARLPAGWKWAFFVVPAALLGAAELRGHGLPALGQYRNIVRVLPDNWQANFFLGYLEKSERDYVNAAAHYEQALALNPDFQPGHAQLAEIYFNTGRRAQSIPHYARAVELNPLDFKSQDHFATALLLENRVAEAVPHLMAAADHAPGDANLAYLTGSALMHVRRPGDAMPYLYRAAALDPQYRSALEGPGAIPTPP